MNRTEQTDDALWTAVTLWYLIVLSLCATAGPGAGLFGAALDLLPSSVHTWLYAPAAGLLAWLLTRSFLAREWPMAAAASVGAALALAFAVFLESAQAWQQARPFVPQHLVWAASGILLAWIVPRLTSHRAAQPPIPATVLPFRRVAGRSRKGSSS